MIPARNEAGAIGELVEQIFCLYPMAEVIVVDDGSTDGTGVVASSAGARVLSHPRSIGNGAAIKSGARVAKYDALVLMDGDGQHSASDLGRLLLEYEKGYDLVVGARSSREMHSSLVRWAGNTLYNGLASIVTGTRITDLTSGFRVVNREKFITILHLLPNKFSYPTTSTIAFLRMGFSVGFCTVGVKPKLTGSHIRVLQDGGRFFIIIFKISFLFSPFKVLLPLSIMQFFIGLMLYLPGLTSAAPSFTNGMALLLTGGVITLGIGILSELITTLLYKT